MTMELKPFHKDGCVMCGCNLTSKFVSTTPAFRYCEGRCIPDGDGGFVNVATTTDASAPHLHRTCRRCGYEWLTETL